jgi:predicted DNA-binding ribbon-helix-helix protein
MEPATTRIEPSVLKEIDRIAERDKMDRATLLRQLIDEGLKTRRLKMALESYRRAKTN